MLSDQSETIFPSSSSFSSTSTYVVSSSSTGEGVSGTGPQYKSTEPSMTTKIFTKGAQANHRLEPIVKKTSKFMKKRS